MTTNYLLGCYCTFKRFSSLPTKRLTGIVVFLTSLGSVGRLKGNWCNYPQGSPKAERIGTLQGQLSFWKGQKRHIKKV